MNNKKIGDFGEAIAADYLKKNGYTIKELNFRNSYGEVDIIATEKDILVFVEVKTRSSKGFGSPCEAVTYKKQQQISKVALSYLEKNQLHDVDARFDVVSILSAGSHESAAKIEIIKNAFDLSYS